MKVCESVIMTHYCVVACMMLVRLFQALTLLILID